MRKLFLILFLFNWAHQPGAQAPFDPFVLDASSRDTLQLPEIAIGKPAAGKRVAVTPPEYKGTNVRHVIYLPETWEKNWRSAGKRYPIVFEYTGNYFPKAGSTGQVEGAGLGYGLSAGKYIWVTLPYINQSGNDNEVTWWGDEKATVAYAKKYVPKIIGEFGGDPNVVFLCGFSRGAIGVNYLGLYDDEIAKLWSAFITHDHFDGERAWRNTTWGMPLDVYRERAAERLKRIGNRPYLVGWEKVASTKNFVASVLPNTNNFHFHKVRTQEIFETFPNDFAVHPHTDRWLLVPSKYRKQTWSWMNEVILNASTSTDMPRPVGHWSSGAKRSPNIIFILADDLGYGDVSAYNENAAFKTPNIDRLADTGMAFTDAHTSAAICTPTRYGILTGRYNWRSPLKNGGFNGYSRPLIPSERFTIAELFRENGYHTSLVGKWHLGWDWTYSNVAGQTDDNETPPQIDFRQPIRNGPVDHGFDYFYGIAASLSSPPYVFVENRQPTSIPKETSVNYDEKAFWRKGPRGSDFRHVEVLQHFTDKAVEYINEQAASESPFFLYFSLTAPHAPIIPTTEFIGRSNTNAYGDFVLMVDDVVGRIVDAVRKDDRLRNTLIIFTSDNGQSPRADFDDDELPQAGHHGSYIYRGKKFDIYEGGHRVPFIASWPDKIKAGTTSDETICTVDLMATVADLLASPLSDDAAEDSYSILPVLLEQQYDRPLRVATVHHSSQGRFAIRKGPWKLILWPGSGGWAYPSTKEEMKGLPIFQLYNLKDDPAEEKNLFNDFPQQVEELKSLLKKYIVEGRSTPGHSQKNDGPERWAQLEWMDF